LEACNTPVEFDVIDNFNINQEDSHEKLMKNNILLVGNLGVEGSKYIENMKCYKLLDLQVHSNII
jgi:hypothetical protein